MIINLLNRKYSPNQKALQKALYNILGLKSKNIYIYELAFRHKSMIIKGKDENRYSYERLEFLGDSLVLGMIIAEYLFKRYPFKSEGFLTDLRSKIVCGKSLSKIAQKIGFIKLIDINENCNLSSALEDVFEAVIGAMFIDKGFNYTRKILIERIIKIHIDIENLIETETNFKSRLIEWAQREKCDLQFVLKDKKIINSKNQYTTQIIIDNIAFAQGINFSIKESEQLAAEKTIEILKEQRRYL